MIWKLDGADDPRAQQTPAHAVGGRVLCLSGRYDSVVYAIDTRTGRPIARVPVGASPHGLSVWPQPGRYSLGHTGNMR